MASRGKSPGRLRLVLGALWILAAPVGAHRAQRGATDTAFRLAYHGLLSEAEPEFAQDHLATTMSYKF